MPARASPVLSWLLILLSVAGIAGAGYWARQQDVEPDDAATLAVLTVQAKLLTALATISPARAARELPALDELAASPAVARALAALNAYALEHEGGLERARTLLGRHAADSLAAPDERLLHEAVRLALEDPGALGDAQRERVERDMKWFGKLLLARGRPSSDPLRREVVRGAFLVLAATIGLVGVAGVGTLAGAVLLVLARAGMGAGRLRPRFAAPAEDGSGPVYLQAFAVYLGLLFVFESGVALAGGGPGALGLLGLVVGSVVGVIWPVLQGVPRQAALRGLGLHRGEGWPREIGCGVVGYVAILPIVAVGILLTLLLLVIPRWIGLGEEAPGGPIGHPVVAWMAEGSAAIRFGILLLASGFAPLFEEAMFRGALFRSLRERGRGPVVSSLTVAFLFAVIHPQGFFVVPGLMSLGFGFALLREWRDSLVAPIVAHAVHNGALVGFMWLVFSA
jgi:membrane protease YdiL (CAAX protease family)